MFECKAIHGNTLNFKSHIRENQWEKLLKYSNIPGVNAGIICWFIDWDITVFIDIQDLEFMKNINKKSFNVKWLNENPIIEIQGKKKKTFFEYNLEEFLKEINYEEV